MIFVDLGNVCMYSVNVGNNFVFIKSDTDFSNEVVKGVKNLFLS